jgi:O-antigen ligase
MVVFLPFSESVKTISLYLLLVIFLLQVYRKEIKPDITLIHVGFIVLILSAFVSSMFAENMAKSLKGLQDIIYYSIVFFVACNMSDEKRSRTILWSLYLSTVAAALVGIVRAVQAHAMIDIHQLRNPNYIAMYLIIVLSSMVSTIVLSDKETKLSKASIGMFALVLLSASVMTEYRSSFIGLFLFLVMIIFARRSIKYSLVVAMVLIPSCSITIFLYKPLWNKLLVTNSLIVRLYIWKDAIVSFKEHPYFGIGLNHFTYLLPPGCPDAGARYNDAHNIYLQTASQMGVLGLIGLFLIMYGFLREFIRSKSLSHFSLSLKYGALGGVLVTFAGGIFDTTLHHGHAIVFTLLMGLFIGNIQKHSTAREPAIKR